MKRIKNKYSALPLNKRAALAISLSVFVVTIGLTFALQMVLRQSELEILDTMRSQFPNYVAARQEILDAFMADRINRYLSFMPLFAVFNFIVLYYVIAYLIGKFYSSSEVKKQEEVFQDFIQNSAHELKTPLFALKTSLDVLKLKSKPSISAYKNFQSAVEMISNRLNRLIESMLIVSKSKEDFVEDELRDVSEVLQKTVELLNNKAQMRKVSIESKIDPGVVYKIQLRYVEALFTNVIDNAIKYSNEGGLVRISLKRKPVGRIEFMCHDNGMGIAQAEQKQIFSKFYRATNAINEGVDGAGLGLAVVRRIVDEYQGSIELQSKIGKGTKLIIKL